MDKLVDDYMDLLMEVGSAESAEELNPLWPRIKKLSPQDRRDIGEQIASRFPEYQPPANS
jgi:hypothetical protein